MIAIGCDHGGVNLKKEVINHLQERGFEVKDFGCNGEKCDYPDIAFAVAESVASGESDKGVLICGTGIGMSIAANKVRGIRAAVVTEPTSAGLTKEHNNTNILCMGERIIGTVLAIETLDSWLYSEFMGGRHQQRIDKIAEYEEKH
ncbi:MAG: ribose 5-phosphate isomerase B [Clostridia bacterium]|nr:ribose 5-phosphate isomerase B [Clostridia bacterium]